MRGQRRDSENVIMVVAKVKMVDVHKAVWDKNRILRTESICDDSSKGKFGRPDFFGRLF